MAEIIEMPKLSDTMVEGVIAAWHKKVGESVDSGELLAEIETDKATMELESFYDGVVLYVAGDDGDSIDIGDLLAIIGEEGEDISTIIQQYKNKAKAVENTTVVSPVDEMPAELVEESAPKDSAPSKDKDVEASAPAVSSSSNGSGRIKASPLAKAMAKDKGIDLHAISGSGDHGRIIKRDIEAYVDSGAGTDTPETTTPGVVGKESFHQEKVSQMRKTIARRLAESKFSAPHFYLTMEIDMDNAWKSRQEMNEVAPVKISFNDLIVKAAAMALRKHPNVNSSWLGDAIRYNEHVHIGVAVAVDEGLLVPVIRFADAKSLSQISTETRELAGKARDKKLQPQEWEGNTFTISNLGMYGIEEFTAIINPPDACIMAIGGILDKAVVKDGQVVPGKRMKVTMSCDHRVVDGATGSEFLQTFKSYLENPVRMLI